jgi:hypothetical protein
MSSLRLFSLISCFHGEIHITNAGKIFGNLYRKGSIYIIDTSIHKDACCKNNSSCSLLLTSARDAVDGLGLRNLSLLLFDVHLLHTILSVIQTHNESIDTKK